MVTRLFSASPFYRGEITLSSDYGPASDWREKSQLLPAERRPCRFQSGCEKLLRAYVDVEFPIPKC